MKRKTTNADALNEVATILQDLIDSGWDADTDAPHPSGQTAKLGTMIDEALETAQAGAAADDDRETTKVLRRVDTLAFDLGAKSVMDAVEACFTALDGIDDDSVTRGAPAPAVETKGLDPEAIDAIAAIKNKIEQVLESNLADGSLDEGGEEDAEAWAERMMGRIDDLSQTIGSGSFTDASYELQEIIDSSDSEGLEDELQRLQDYLEEDSGSVDESTLMRSAGALVTKTSPEARDFISRLGGASVAIERELEHGDFAGGELMAATAEIGLALTAADEDDWAGCAEHLDEAATFLDSDEVTEDGSLASTVTALDAFREEALGYAKETKSMPGRALATKALAFQAIVVTEGDASSGLAALDDLLAAYGNEIWETPQRCVVYFEDEATMTEFVDEVNNIDDPTIAVESSGAKETKTMSRRALRTKGLRDDLEALLDLVADTQEDRRGTKTREVKNGLINLLGAERDGTLSESNIETFKAFVESYSDELNEVFVDQVADLEWTEEKSIGETMKGLFTKYCDYPSYAGMPFGSPTLSTRYVDVPASECAELSYSVREAGEALEAASEIYLQRAAAAARGEGDAGDEGDSAPDVAAMNTLNGVAVQLETLADRLLAVGDPGSAASGNGPYVTAAGCEIADAPRCFYSWPDCLPSCLAAVEGALGSVTGDAEYLEVAAQLTVVRDMLRGLLTEDEDEGEAEETTELGEMKSAGGVRTKGRLGRLSAVSDKVDYAVDALAGFSRGTPGVTDALRILKDMQTAIEDGDRDAFGEALDELGGVRDEVDGDLDEGETGEFPHELAWLLSDLTDAYYGNKAARGVRTKGGSTEQDIYDGWSDVVDATTGLDAGVIQEIIGKLQDLVDAEPMDVQAVSDAIADAVLNAGEYEDAEALVSALERFDRIVGMFEITKGHNAMRTKKASRRSRFGDERSAMDTLAELSTQLDRVTDEAWTGRRRIVDSKARAALETAVAAASFVAESVHESVDAKAPLSAEQLAEELGRASDALRVLEKSGDPWATTFRDDLSEFGSLLGRSASALDQYLDERGEASGDEDGSPPGAKDESRGSKLRRRQLAARERGEAEIVRKADRAARLAREVQGLERAINSPEAANDAAFARAVTAPQSALAARRASRVRAY